MEGSGCWAIDHRDETKQGLLFRAHCKFGWQALQYAKRLASGSKVGNDPHTRGFAKPDEGFKNCPSELRVKLTPGRFLQSVEVRLIDETGAVHTHGPPEPGVVITPALVKADVSLATLNSISHHARNRGITPGAVLGESLQDLDVALGHHHNAIIRHLTSWEGKLQLRRHVVKVRGQNRPVTVQDLYELQKQQQHACEHASHPAHTPRVIGIAFDESTNNFAVTISTDAMLDAAVVASSNDLVIATDCTFKRVRIGADLTVGAIDRCGHYRFLCIGFTSGETSWAYENVFNHLKQTISRRRGLNFNPKYLMGDSSNCLNGAMLALSSATKRVNCFSHVMKAIHQHIRYVLIADFESPI